MSVKRKPDTHTKAETAAGRPGTTFTRPKQASRLQPKVKQARIKSKKGRGD
jgi:hypothetical protein